VYNLFVSGKDEEWNGEAFILEIGRCVREHTGTEIINRYGELTSEQVNAIKRFPSIFAYESKCKKDPKFGIVREVTKRQRKAKIEYELVELERFITHSDIDEMKFELDISHNEMNTTHWAIKDINLINELSAKGVLLPSWSRNETKSVNITSHIFDVAFSFPGEVRGYVESVAAELEKAIGPNSYFYDKNSLVSGC